MGPPVATATMRTAMRGRLVRPGTAANRLFAALADGTIRPGGITRHPLKDAAQAEIEARRTCGSVILLP